MLGGPAGAASGSVAADLAWLQPPGRQRRVFLWGLAVVFRLWLLIRRFCQLQLSKISLFLTTLCLCALGTRELQLEI